MSAISVYFSNTLWNSLCNTTTYPSISGPENQNEHKSNPLSSKIWISDVQIPNEDDKWRIMVETLLNEFSHHEKFKQS